MGGSDRREAGDREVALWLHVREGSGVRGLPHAGAAAERRDRAVSVGLAPSSFSHQIMTAIKIIKT